jgi:uncharacterized protein YbjQ (UPF0145 family)
VVNIKEDNKGAKKGDPVYYRGGSFKDATAEEAIEEAYKKCKSLGANGLINIKITPYISKQYCILVTGLAVKM